MKIAKILYWVSTVALALFILPGIFFMNSPMAMEGIAHIGPFPEWFRIESGIAVFLAGLVLIIPKLPSRIKEWAYVGLAITYISAFIGHMSVDGLVFITFTPLITLAILIVSYVTYHKVYVKTK